jgi:cytidylate kinase
VRLEEQEGLGEQDITWALRGVPVTASVSIVSAHPQVRALLIAQQRALSAQGQVVMVGRDIGAVVLPDAELKIYLTASLEERARRRASELVEHSGIGRMSTIQIDQTMQTVMQEIQRRDTSDREQMRPANDAIIILTDHLSIDEVLATIYRYVEETT